MNFLYGSQVRDSHNLQKSEILGLSEQWLKQNEATQLESVPVRRLDMCASRWTKFGDVKVSNVMTIAGYTVDARCMDETKSGAKSSSQ